MEYHDPTEWPRIWEANQGQTEDDGRVFTDPHWIYPGWELEVPGVGGAVDAPAPSAPMPVPAGANAVVSGCPGCLCAHPDTHCKPYPHTGADPDRRCPGGRPRRGAHLRYLTMGVRPRRRREAGEVVLAEGGVIAGATAAAAIGLLLAAQRHERWRRRPGTSGGSRVALLARRPNWRRVRAALASATAPGGTDGQESQPQAAAFQATLERL